MQKAPFTAGEPLLEAGAIDLWLIALSAPASAEDAALLDEAERARAERFVFERDRRRFVRAHAALRRVLAGYLAHDAADLRFAARPGGKPMLAAPGNRGIDFNLSHSGDRALVAVAGGPIGVDIECLRPVADAKGLAGQHFTAAEAAALDAVGPDDRDRAFLVGWVRKEACLKAIGAGLLLSPRAVDCGIDEADRAVRVRWDDVESELIVRSVACGQELLAAVAMAAGEPHQRTIRLRLVSG
jgi:4'-phosphopantetheinyl transferase